MTKSINKAIIIGRLGSDPELRQGSKTEHTCFSLADSRFVNGQEEVQWHRISAFGKQAQLVSKYLHKGDLCCIEGHLDSHTYEKDGVKKRFQSVIADSITFISSSRRNKPQTAHPMSNSFEEAFPD